MTSWQNWRRLSWRDRCLLIEAFVWLGLVRAAVCAVPFKRIAPYLKTSTALTSETSSHDWADEACRVGWAISAAASHTVWKSNCLAQAIAGKAMLWRRGIASTLYLGAAKGDDGCAPVAAHAWLRCATQIVTGASGHERFTIIAIFGDDEHAVEKDPYASLRSNASLQRTRYVRRRSSIFRTRCL